MICKKIAIVMIVWVHSDEYLSFGVEVVRYLEVEIPIAQLPDIAQLAQIAS